VVLAVLVEVRPAGLTIGSERGAWAVVSGLVVLGGLLVLARPAAVVGAVVLALIGYVVLAAPVQLRAAPSDAETIAALPTQAVARPVGPEEVRRPALGVSTETVGDFTRFISRTGTVPDRWDMFQPWSTGKPLDVQLADNVVSRGVHLSITWMPWNPDGSPVSPGDHSVQPDYTLASIIDGSHDAYIDMFARSVAQVPATVTIRLMHEMNGSWYPWSPEANGNAGAAQFVAAWRHVHDRFAALGVTNVSWQWAPNAVYDGGVDVAPLYPGDAYVDEIGVDNYNWGDFTHDGSTTQWATFDELFDRSIATLQRISSRPLWIAEVGTTDKGGHKSAWLAATLAEVAQRPEIAGLVYFDHVDPKAGVDWRIDRDPAAIRAWDDAFRHRPVVRVGVPPGRHAD
jgi:beta-mannanase